MADGSLKRLRRSTYAPDAVLEPDDEARRLIAAVCLTRHPEAVVSHVSAALVHGLPVRNAAKEIVHVSRWSTSHGKTTHGVRLHRVGVPEGETMEIDGLRVTSLERTIADVARTEPYEWAVAVADAGLRRQASRALLADMAERDAGRPGVGRLRRALDFADPRAESVAESISRVSIARAGLPTPDLQVQITNGDGEWVAVGDFGWRDLTVLGETDGKGKYVDDTTRNRTAADVVMKEKDRDARVIEAGWWPVHWGWKIATDHRLMGDLIRSAFRQRR